jgi:outer membrane protein assembly factor BamB
VDDSGHVRWQTPLQTPSSPPSTQAGPVTDGTLAYFTQDGTVFAIQVATGRLVWQWHGGSGVSGMWPAAGLLTVLADQTGPHPVLAGLDTATGQVRWSEPMPGVLGTPLPTTGNGLVLANTGHSLQTVNLSDGRQRWSVPSATDPAGFGAVSGLVLGTTGGTLTAYDEHTGRKRWRLAGLPAQASMRVDSGLALVGAAGYGAGIPTALTAVDPATGKVRWRFDQGSMATVLAAGPQGIAVATSSPQGALYLLDPVSGQARWHANTAVLPDVTPALLPQDVISVEAGVNVRLVDRAAGNGSVRWQVNLGTRPAGKQPVLTIGSHAVVQTEGPASTAPLLAYDLRSGAATWTAPMPTTVPLPPTMSGTTLLVQPSGLATACAATG